MSTTLASGVYRRYCDVTGPKGSARVERIDDGDHKRDRYRVGFNDAPVAVAICWRFKEEADKTGSLDGGWERAISIAEHLTQGRAGE